MKAILILIAAVGIHISTLVAGPIGSDVILSGPTDFFCPECPILSPKVPLEAPFREMTEFDILTGLNPIVPNQASFDDDFDFDLATNSLAPVLPLQADFDDNVALPLEQDKHLAPVVPVIAEFSDAL
ncbi:MAG: hypothetical protein D4R67_07405 [Bacteroidetes bacterium]|nr:MAG: hypothetical protein D4R67_07405 [Bacteroidota bacterium]